MLYQHTQRCCHMTLVAEKGRQVLINKLDVVKQAHTEAAAQAALSLSACCALCNDLIKYSDRQLLITHRPGSSFFVSNCELHRKSLVDSPRPPRLLLAVCHVCALATAAGAACGVWCNFASSRLGRGGRYHRCGTLLYSNVILCHWDPRALSAVL